MPSGFVDPDLRSADSLSLSFRDRDSIDLLRSTVNDWPAEQKVKPYKFHTKFS
jgi:hypothetical protein